jgi:ankyrin repeat protein
MPSFDKRMNEMLIAAVMDKNKNNVQKVLDLLRNGADANTRTRYGYTVLHLAVRKGKDKLVRVLLNNGADIDVVDNSNQTPLHWACIPLCFKIIHGGGCTAVVMELLRPCSSILGKRKTRVAYIDAEDVNGNTPLHLASRFNFLGIVKLLVSKGANVRAVNSKGLLPIHLAVSPGVPFTIPITDQAEVVKCLLKQWYANNMSLPLHGLVEDQTPIPYSNDAPPPTNLPPLRYALERDAIGTDDVVEIIEYLVSQKPECLISRDSEDASPLHVGCRRGASFAIVQALAKIGSVKSFTSQGDLPLFLACDLPEPSLDTIFLLVKLYPELVGSTTSLSPDDLLLDNATSEIEQRKTENAELKTSISKQMEALHYVALICANSNVDWTWDMEAKREPKLVRIAPGWPPEDMVTLENAIEKLEAENAKLKSELSENASRLAYIAGAMAQWSNGYTTRK